MIRRFQRRRLTTRCTKVRSRREHAFREGTIAAELALVLPLLCMITFGSIQLANTIHLKQALTTAVFEGTRSATGSSANREKIQSRAQAILTARQVTGATITILPIGDLSLLSPGTPIEIRITAPIAGNITGPSFVTMSSTISVSGKTVR